MTARRRDRIPCIQACHPAEVALRIHFTCCVFLSIELRVQRPASNSGSNAPHESPLSSSISAEVSNCPVIEEIALPSVPTFFPVSRSAIPCLQSTCRNRGLIGESGRDAATKFVFFNSVRSLLTVPVPKLRLELDREDDSLLSVRVPHECAKVESAQSWVVHFDQLAMRYQNAPSSSRSSHVCLRYATPAALAASTVLPLSDSACNRPVKAAIPGGPRPCPYSGAS